jgi:hypothetical protein
MAEMVVIFSEIVKKKFKFIPDKHWSDSTC